MLFMMHVVWRFEGQHYRNSLDDVLDRYIFLHEYPVWWPICCLFSYLSRVYFYGIKASKSLACYINTLYSFFKSLTISFMWCSWLPGIVRLRLWLSDSTGHLTLISLFWKSSNTVCKEKKRVIVVCCLIVTAFFSFERFWAFFFFSTKMENVLSSILFNRDFSCRIKMGTVSFCSSVWYTSSGERMSWMVGVICAILQWWRPCVFFNFVSSKPAFSYKADYIGFWGASIIVNCSTFF